MLERLDLIKDLDPFNKTLLNDCRNVIVDLNNEIRKLQEQNKREKT